MSTTTQPVPAVSARAHGVTGEPTGTSTEALQHLQLDLERLIDAYELEVICHSCKTIHKCAIGWLRVHSTMECATCQSAIVLRTSLMNEEMRRVARQLRKLRQQLTEMIERAAGILGQ